MIKKKRGDFYGKDKTADYSNGERNKAQAGRTWDETVLSSDNATIAVPAGIVAVAVEGEAAVKVVVK